jgi:hypothetical protein
MMKPADFRSRFSSSLSSIMSSIAGFRKVSVFPNIFLGKKNVFEISPSRTQIERGLFRNNIHPSIAEEAFRLFSQITLLEMHSAGESLEELRIIKLLELKDPDGFMRLDDNAKRSLLESTGAVKIKRLSAEELNARETKRLEEYQHKLTAAQEWRSLRGKKGRRGNWQPDN